MLPKNLKYQTRVESAPARSLRSNIAPQSGTGNYGFGDTIVLNIPTTRNAVLNSQDSYFKCDIELGSGAVANQQIRWDSCGAHSIIQRLRIFSGSNLLEDIDNYNMLAKILFDLQIPGDASEGKMTILSGTRRDRNTQLPAIADVAGADVAALVASVNARIALLTNANRQTLQINSGESLTNGGADNNYTAKRTYCLNLISILGTLSNQYFPLFACSSAPLRFEITLAPNAISCINSVNALNGGDNPILKVSNVEYVANILELSDVAMGMIQSSLNGQPLQYVVPSYKNFQFTQSNLQNVATVLQVPIAAKYSSVKSIICSIRDKPATLNYFPFSSTTTGITSYYFRIGANVHPQKQPDTLPEMFSELLKAISSMSNIDHHPAIEISTYSLNASPQCNTSALMSNTSSGSFYLGIDLENYANSSNFKDSVFSGYNSNTEDIYAVINLTPPAATTAVRIDSFCMFDSVLVFENSTAYSRF